MSSIDKKNRSRSYVRPTTTIRSAVPNSQLTTVAKRPSQSGHGNNPLLISLIYLNFFLSAGQ